MSAMERGAGPDMRADGVGMAAALPRIDANGTAHIIEIIDVEDREAVGLQNGCQGLQAIIMDMLVIDRIKGCAFDQFQQVWHFEDEDAVFFQDRFGCVQQARHIIGMVEDVGAEQNINRAIQQQLFSRGRVEKIIDGLDAGFDGDFGNIARWLDADDAAKALIFEMREQGADIAADVDNAGCRGKGFDGQNRLGKFLEMGNRNGRIG